MGTMTNIIVNNVFIRFLLFSPHIVYVILLSTAGCTSPSVHSPNSVFIQTNRLPDTTECRIYNPPKMHAETSFPVVILLTNRTDKIDFFERNNIITHLHEWMTEGLIPPALLVVPESQDGLWWNYFDQSLMYADFIVNDLLPELQKRYPVSSDSRNHHVFGIGTGAMGAVEMAVLHAGSFASVGALNGFYLDAHGAATYIRQHPFQKSRQVFGPPENTHAMAARSIYRYINSSSCVNGTRFVLGYCGSAGWDMIENNTLFQEHLLKLNISHDLVNVYGPMSQQTTVSIIPVFVALQLGLKDIHGEIETVSWQVLKYR
jgi:enterochelin esterase-like enzyme